MSRIMCLAFVGVVSATAAPAASAADPLDVVKKAIDAYGGKAKLTKYNAATLTGEGTVSMGGMKFDYTATWYFYYPDKMRFELEATIDGNAIKGVLVVNGKEGWQKFGDMGVTKMNDDQLKAFHTQFQVDVAASFVPLLDKKKYTVSSVGEVEVNGKKSIALNVTNRTGLDVNLYLDPKTHLIVKQEYQTKTDSGKDVTQAVYMSKYKKVDGVPFPMFLDVHHDGKRAVTAEFDSVKMDEKLDASLFKKPK